MRATKRLAALALLSISPAFAQEPATGPEPAPAGTAEGAKALTDGLVPYFGRGAFDNGTLKVEPDPAGYRLILDPKPLTEALKGPDGTFTMSPWSIVVSRRDDGNWNTFSDAPLDFAMRRVTQGVEQTIEYNVGPQRAKGVFAPALAAFLSATGAADGASIRTRQAEGGVAATIGPMRFDITGTPATDNTVDMAMRQTVKDFAETISTTGGPDTLPGGVKLDVKAASYESSVAIAGARSRPLVDLYGFFVANPEYLAPAPDKAKLAATQNELKSRLGAALPLWNGMKGAYTLSGIEVGSQFGSVKAERVGLSLDMTGVAEAAAVGYAIGFAGLDVSSPMMPPWAASLLPREMDLHFKLDGMNLKAPAAIALADFDLSRPEPVSPEAQARIGETFAASPPRFVIEPSRIVARDYDLAMSGSVVVQNDRPAMTMDISAGGMDKAIATLQGAAQAMPDLNQAVGVLAMAKGFGKTLPDGRTQWIVDASSDGSVKVNGFQVKGPDPAIEPSLELPESEAPTDDNALPDAPPQ